MLVSKSARALLKKFTHFGEKKRGKVEYLKMTIWLRTKKLGAIILVLLLGQMRIG
jgi:hypothetical protein